MKKTLTFVALITILVVIYLNNQSILTNVLRKLRGDTSVQLTYKNEYTRSYHYNYVQVTDDFDVKTKKQLNDVYYTILNSGINEFSFYCDDSYKTCIEDVKYLADNQQDLSLLNGFVHPYNSFSSIETAWDTLGKVTLRINKTYTEEDIATINNKVIGILNNELKNKEDPKEIIKEFHDYIINNTKYDVDRSDNNIIKYNSSTAYGPLMEGYGICGGYTDAMTVVLDIFNIHNYSVISENHIWNAVYLDNKWLHLDLTWDDPITDIGQDILDYSYYLISTEELLEMEVEQHNFNQSVFSEVAAK